MRGKMRATLALGGRLHAKESLACSAAAAHRSRPMKTPISLIVVAAASVAGISCLSAARSTEIPVLVVAEPNDNRVSAGRFRGGVMTVDLDAVWAGWRPDLDV